jgi:tryptophanyl-tRNA synthetase
MARVLSGIQPTGDIHIGNYIGALRHWAADQEVNDCFYCLVDLHSITHAIPDPEVLRVRTLEAAAILLAVGIDPERSTLFVQSHVAEHTQLTWVLTCFTSFGELRRMTQFKEKGQSAQEGFVSAGLFEYPVLQAADILLYQADRVPVGEDQRQHLELTRDVAQRFNQRYGETFVLPEAAIPGVGAKIMDLQNPGAKMSKSADSPGGTLRITDPPEEIARKIKSAVTDSGRDVRAAEDKPAISNLLTIYSAVDGRSIPELEQAYAGKGYGDLKQDLADAVIDFLAPFHEHLRRLTSNLDEVERLLEGGAQKAQGVAAKTLALVYERVGFLPRRGGS